MSAARRRLVREYLAALLGIKGALVVLKLLYDLGEASHAEIMNEAIDWGVGRTAASTAIRELLGRGLISYREVRRNRYVERYYRLTDRGKVLAEAVAPALNEIRARVEEVCGEQ